MFLEARAANCFASTYVLKFNGNAVGKYETRFLSEGVDIALTGRRQLRFEKVGWVGSNFSLGEAGSDKAIGSVDRAGVFSSSWELRFKAGAARLERTGFFDSGYVVRAGHETVASVDRLGMCQRGWVVQAADGDLTLEEMILVGLVYHVILSRQAQHAAAAGHAGS
jgi:hypothetical protein